MATRVPGKQLRHHPESYRKLLEASRGRARAKPATMLPSSCGLSAERLPLLFCTKHCCAASPQDPICGPSPPWALASPSKTSEWTIIFQTLWKGTLKPPVTGDMAEGVGHSGCLVTDDAWMVSPGINPGSPRRPDIALGLRTRLVYLWLPSRTAHHTHPRRFRPASKGNDMVAGPAVTSRRSQSQALAPSLHVPGQGEGANKPPNPPPPVDTWRAVLFRESREVGCRGVLAPPKVGIERRRQVWGLWKVTWEAGVSEGAGGRVRSKATKGSSMRGLLVQATGADLTEDVNCGTPGSHVGRMDQNPKSREAGSVAPRRRPP
nr:uncharacterized protein LOC119619314 [Chlorocebus sabaeus]XP_037840805.1 uncharacterized protein LOC119619314 [Chlorocebus sabaeus]XP_037840806.1 uncharacterized protein LOC119619314 [Chlorocebus sabaeus]XP_037840807.1 uncharacterized protein LOC119619314 [Chlorocebus sabaeus]XP_037840808.1 uncharacterized protein LOC119619314 [Chlorocebus sabaeus]XP_037840809.1 uncharacterized protein LOC119619314 [Chlorocebus sabaeus]